MYGDFNYTTTFGKKERNKDNTGPDMKDIETEKPPKNNKGDQSGTYTAPSNEVSGPKTAEWAKKFGGSEGLNQKADAAKNIGSILSSGQVKSLNPTDPVRGGKTTNTVPGEEIVAYGKNLKKGNKQLTYDEWEKLQKKA
mgnify:CR=1 FL=1